MALNNNQPTNQSIPGLSLTVIPSSMCWWMYFINSYIIQIIQAANIKLSILKEYGNQIFSHHFSGKLFSHEDVKRLCKSMKRTLTPPEKLPLGPSLVVEASGRRGALNSSDAIHVHTASCMLNIYFHLIYKFNFQCTVLLWIWYPIDLLLSSASIVLSPPLFNFSFCT